MNKALKYGYIAARHYLPKQVGTCRISVYYDRRKKYLDVVSKNINMVICDHIYNNIWIIVDEKGDKYFTLVYNSERKMDQPSYYLGSSINSNMPIIGESFSFYRFSIKRGYGKTPFVCKYKAKFNKVLASTKIGINDLYEVLGWLTDQPYGEEPVRVIMTIR